MKLDIPARLKVTVAPRSAAREENRMSRGEEGGKWNKAKEGEEEC